MAKSVKKSPTLFYWLSLACSAGTVVMTFFPWLTLQVTSFGYTNAADAPPSYKLTEIDALIAKVGRDVNIGSGGLWDAAPEIAKWALFLVIAAQALYVLWALITVRRTPPRGIFPAAVSVAVGSAFVVSYVLFNSYIQTHRIDDYTHIEFNVSVFPFLVILLGVGTLAFGLVNRRESRLIASARRPREIVFPPENPEPV